MRIGRAWGWCAAAAMTACAAARPASPAARPAVRPAARPARPAVLLALAATLAAVLFALAGAHPAAAAHFGAEVTPVYDRGYKVDLVASLAQPPELVIFGGSRAQRFEPSFAKQLTGLPAFNFAVQNSRPEDAYAMARYLLWRAPGVRLHCVWALQASTLADSPLHPGLLADDRLTQFLPEYFMREQREVVVATEGRELGSDNEFTARGQLLYNGYDQRLDRGISLATTLSGYLSKMVPKAAAPMAYTQTRAKTYFERTLELYNLHDVEPVLVIMPYHPTALAAFREAGWEAKEEAFKAYLESLRGRYRFHLVDYTDIASFDGLEEGFYDGAHVTTANSRRILSQVVRDVPQAFR